MPDNLAAKGSGQRPHPGAVEQHPWITGQVKAVTRSELIDLLNSHHRQLAPRDAELAVKTLLDAMSETLAHGNRIEIRGFGTFDVTYRPPRVARNPRTGKSVQVPSKAVPRFKPGKALRHRVDRHRN